MRLRVNGDERAVEPGLTVARLLEGLALSGRPCAVEVNAVVVPRREHDSRQLRDGDAVEIVTLVGGG
jgi:thiamine biosynthesis protein ThiS